MDYYEYLDIPATATLEEIKSAYLSKRAQLQSAEMDEPSRTEQLGLLDKAYAVLVEMAQDAEIAFPVPEVTGSTALTLKGIAGDLALPQTPQTKPQRPCPHCGALNPIQATMCQVCGQQMARPCPACGQIISLIETVCPRCDAVIAEYDQRRFVEAEVIQKQVTDERRASRARVDALEAIHRLNAQLGVVFWVIVVMLCVGLTLITTFLYNYFSQIYP
jgi:hypothetical protein